MANWLDQKIYHPGPASLNGEVGLHALIMLPPSGSSEAEQWVAAGRRACAQDLAQRLISARGIEQVIAIVASAEDHDSLSEIGIATRMSLPGKFHFGSALAELINEEEIQNLAYFGGASAPLLEQSKIDQMFEKVQSAKEPYAIANNLHSTDWMIIKGADLIAAHSHRLPSDNPLGWVLSREAGMQVESLEPSAATRLDIDTPTDLFMAIKHPAVGPELGKFLKEISSEVRIKMEAIRSVITKPASTLVVIGRASEHLWKTLVASTQIWVRLYVEERGMVASHRLANGEVRSLIGQMLDLCGPEDFVERLSTMADGTLWDTRVWMGTLTEWPSDADRFSADLGWSEQVHNPWLRTLTEVVNRTEMPIICGGYGVVGGGLYALLESLQTEE